MQRVIDIALSEVGYLEKATPKELYSKTANPGRNNYTKYAAEMSPYSPGIYANGYAWCDTFVDWCFVKAYGDMAKSLIYGWSAYTPTSASYYKQHGRWHTAPKIGDQIFFKDSDGTICHTGIVYDLDDFYVYTVEGNTSYQTGVVANGGAVAKKMYKRDYSSIAGYGRPDYSKVAPKEEPKEVQSMYNTVDTCPNWAKPYVAEAVSRGYIKGDDKSNLNLDDNKIWCLVVMMRIAGVMN